MINLYFIGCNKLECLYIPYTCPEEKFDAILGGADTIGAISFWDRPYVPEELDPNESWRVDDEENVCTKTQVAAIKAKGWKPRYYNEEEDEWIEYEGSDE